MYRNNKLAKSVRLALMFGATATAFSTAAVAQEQNEATAERVERIQVTGSRISRTDMETSTQVTVFDASEIRGTGVNTVAEFLRENASTGGFNESATLSQAAGASSMGIKGFGDEYTLILLNGRRLPKNSAGGIFVDINQIPMAAIERIEILGDGASAIYGSDAVAGVINVITKTDFEGVEVNVTHGFNLSEGDGKETGFSVVAGAGTDRTNILFAVDYFKRGSINAVDREMGNAFTIRDDEGNVIPGGEGRSPYGIPVSVWIDGSDAASSFYGQTPAYGSGWVPSNTCDPDNIPAFNENGSPIGQCQYDSRDLYQLQPESNRQSLLTIVNHEFNNSTRGTLQARYTRAFTQTSNAPAPGAITVANDSPFIEDFLFNDLFQNDQATAQAVWQDVQADETSITVGRRFLDFPNRTNDNTNETFEVIAGLEHDLNINYTLSGDVGFSRLTNRQIGAAGILLSDPVTEAFSGDLLNPFMLNDCDVDAETRALCDSLQASTHRTGTYELGFGNILLTGFTDIELPGGQLAFATGLDVRNERYTDVSDPATVSGQVIGGAGSNGGGSFNNQAAFLELSLPLTYNFDLDLAVRHDKADWDLADDSATTYSVKAAYRPLDNLLLRASYGTGFKAPNLSNLFLSRSSGVTNAVDTTLCNQQIAAGGAETGGDCERRQLNSQGGGNPELVSETSKSFNVGVVYEPLEGLSVSADYWNLSIDDIVGSLAIQEILDEEAEGRLTDLVVRTDSGRIDDSARTGYVQTNLQNLNESSAQGIIWNVRYATELSFGLLSANFRADQFLKFDTQNSASQPLCDSLSQSASRSWNANADLSLRTGDFTTTLTMRHLPGYNNWRSRDTANFSCERVGWTDVERGDDGELISGGSPLSVGSYTEFGINTTYDFASNQAVTVGIRNLLDRNPPHSQWDSWPFYSQSTYSNIGRFIYASYRVSF